VDACETQVPDEELEKWIVAWPGRVPKKAKTAPDTNGRAKKAAKAG